MDLIGISILAAIAIAPWAVVREIETSINIDNQKIIAQSTREDKGNAY